MFNKIQKKENGKILIMVIVFCAISMMIAVSLIEIMSLLHKASLKKQNLERAFQVAEAGINYYKWRLSHSPDNFSGGDQYYDYKDSSGNVVGQFYLEVTEPPLGSSVVTIKSTGEIGDDPGVERIIEAKLAISSLSDYAFLTNSNVWVGEDEEIVGKMHSNGGIRFDGESDSTVNSSLSNYICGPEHGCSNEEHEGVWGSGEIQELWRFPPDHEITNVDFDSIILDLDNLRDEALSDGVYLGNSGGYGWHVFFEYNSNTFKAYKVTDVHWNKGWDFTDGWQWRGIDIKTEGTEEIYNLPNNGIIFVEDNVWVDGETDERLTVASADFENAGVETDIIINGNITYREKDGSAAVGLIAQSDVLIPLYSPEQLEINAAMLAQGGHCFRYYYPESSYGDDAIKNRIEIWGSVISNTVWTWSWVEDEDGPVISGYNENETTYDPYLTFGPPPEFPNKGSYKVITWREIK